MGRIVTAMALAFFAVLVCSEEPLKAQDAPGASGAPNILFVMADDMPEGLLSAEAMPETWGRLVEGGTRFENAYVTDSLCCPSRATALTGMYAHNHGIGTNIEPQGGDQGFRNSGLEGRTAATLLDGAGYRTGFVGKYFNGYNPKRPVPPGWDLWRAHEDARMRVGDRVIERRGVMAEVDNREAFDFLDRATSPAAAPSGAAEDAPFALFLWTPAPHLPPEHHSRYDELYRDEPLPRPGSFDEADVSDKPKWVRDLPRVSGGETRTLREWHREQLRSLRGLDDGMAKMLDLLEDRGELENTYVVFTADNGTHMGEHRWFQGSGAKNTPYEEAASVPLAVSGPGVPEGVVRDELVANNDYAPTFAEIADAGAPPSADGRSLLPLLSAASPGEPVGWRTALLNERLEPPRPNAPMPRYGALVTSDGLKYVEYANGEKELYDLDADPEELRSLHDDPAHADKMFALSARLDALRRCEGEVCRAAEDGDVP